MKLYKITLQGMSMGRYSPCYVVANNPDEAHDLVCEAAEEWTIPLRDMELDTLQLLADSADCSDMPFLGLRRRK